MSDPKSDPPILDVKKTYHFQDLLTDREVVMTTARAYPVLERVLLNLQLDAVSEANASDAGHVVLAFKRMRDALYAIRTKGDAIIQQEKQADAKNS